MKIIKNMLVASTIVVAGVWGGVAFWGAKSISDLLGDNKELKAALANLTHENNVAYAKVLDQQVDEAGNVVSSHITFKEFSQENLVNPIFDKEFTIKGDIAHFDALIISFPEDLVSSGEKKSLYLWHRAYGDETPPNEGVPLEELNSEPQRYVEFFDAIGVKNNKVFWQAMWNLASNANALAEYNIKAVHGSGLYIKMKPKVVYEFRFSDAGKMTIIPKPEI